MTREERINAVLGKKPAARTGAAAGEKKARSERYGQMKKDIAQAKAREKKTAEKPAAAPVRKDWTGFVEYRNKAANVKMLWMLKALI